MFVHMKSSKENNHGPKKILLSIHIIALVAAVLNSLIKGLTVYSLEGNVEFGLEIAAAISGLILFFFYVKPFRKITLYFSIYATAAFFLLAGFIFRGLVFSILLFPLIPDDKKWEENGIIISIPFRGFMAVCCSYRVTERRLLIFEKDYGLLELEGEGWVDFETLRIESTETDIDITFSTDSGKQVVRKIKK